jgi:putative hydrolase of the HAD superfamily
VKALLLDLDDTILDYSGRAETCWTESCTAVAEPAGVDPDALDRVLIEVRRWFWSDPERHRLERTDMVGAWAKIAGLGLQRLGLPADGLARAIAEDFAARRCAAERLFPEALATLEWMQARRVPLGLVTNGDARLQRDKIARHDLQRFFDVVVIEGEFGCGKPDHRVFRHALQTLGVPAHGAWMVGDRLDWDVEGAQKVGLGGIWIDRARAGLPVDSCCRPDHIVHALAELRDLAR